MTVEGYCHDCKKTWDAHWKVTSIMPHRGMFCPFCSSTETNFETDESIEYDARTATD